jgi:hypothetical protein
MNKSDMSYLLTVLFFALGFIGFAIFADQGMNTMWYAALAMGIVLFLLRIGRGDD